MARYKYKWGWHGCLSLHFYFMGMHTFDKNNMAWKFIFVCNNNVSWYQSTSPWPGFRARFIQPFLAVWHLQLKGVAVEPGGRERQVEMAFTGRRDGLEHLNFIIWQMDIASIGKKTVRVNVRKIQDCDEIDVGPDCTLTCFLFCADLLKTL